MACGHQHGAQKRDHRTLAIGARDMHDRRQAPLGMAERGEQSLDPAQAQVDEFGMQAQQLRKYGVN